MSMRPMGSENRQFMPQEDQAKALWLTPSQLEFFEPIILHSHQKLSCLKSVVEFDMNDILYEFKNLHHFYTNYTAMAVFRGRSGIFVLKLKNCGKLYEYPIYGRKR